MPYRPNVSLVTEIFYYYLKIELPHGEKVRDLNVLYESMQNRGFEYDLYGIDEKSTSTSCNINTGASDTCLEGVLSVAVTPPEWPIAL